MFNVVGKHLVQEEGGEWRAEETRGGWATLQKVEHPSLNSWLCLCPSVTLCHASRNPPIKYVTSRNTPLKSKDCLALICASELCKERSYKYRITAVLHCILQKIVKKLTTN